MLKTHEEFMMDLEIKNKVAYDAIEFKERYAGNKIKLLAINMFGEILVKPNSLLSGNIPTIKAAVNKTEYYKKLLEYTQPEIFNSLVYIGEYIDSYTHLIIEDKYGVCKMLPNSLLGGKRTSLLGAINKHLYFIELLKEKNPGVYFEFEFIDKYRGGHTKLKICNEFGMLEASPSYLLSGRQPTIQSAIDKNKYFNAMGRAVHGDKYDYSKVSYTKSTNKITITCTKCDNKFNQTPKSHLYGKGCPNCVTSLGEDETLAALKKFKIELIQQHTFADCKNIRNLKFDFYLTYLNTCIEYDGEQHFQSYEYFGGERGLEYRKNNDEIKNKFCRDNNIKLIRIPYWDFENIETILINELNLKEEQI